MVTLTGLSITMKLSFSPMNTCEIAGIFHKIHCVLQEGRWLDKPEADIGPRSAELSILSLAG